MVQKDSIFTFSYSTFIQSISGPLDEHPLAPNLDRPLVVPPAYTPEELKRGEGLVVLSTVRSFLTG